MDIVFILWFCSIVMLLFSSSPVIRHFYWSQRQINRFQTPQGANVYPKVTIFLPVRNESDNILIKINEILKLDYPRKSMQLLIIDSSSEDGTVESARTFLNNIDTDVRWDIVQLKVLGKSRAVNYAIKNADTEFLVMMDADSLSTKNCLRLMMDHFADPRIGAVCGQHQLDRNHPEYPYRSRYNILRVGESVIDSTPIFEGSLCSFRLSALAGKQINDDMNADDSQLAMLIRSNGYRAIMDPRVLFFEKEGASMNRARKLRRAQGLVRALLENKSLCLGENKYSRIIRNCIYFYVVYPWLVFISFAFIILGGFLYSTNFVLEIKFFGILLTTTIPLLASKTLRSYLHGCHLLIEAQTRLIFGSTFEIWDPGERT